MDTGGYVFAKGGTMETSRGIERGTKSTVRARRNEIGFWIFTSLFVLQMGFTAYAQLCLPQVAKVFTHLGFPSYFRIELSFAKFAGLIVLIAPAPARLKEWAYAGFTITLASALIAHLAVGDDISKWSWSVGTFVLGALSYYFFRKTSAKS
jgi:DoxX-like family